MQIGLQEDRQDVPASKKPFAQPWHLFVPEPVQIVHALSQAMHFLDGISPY